MCNNNTHQHFAQHSHRGDCGFTTLFNGLISTRLCTRDWTHTLSDEHRYVILVVVRILTRDPCFQNLLVESCALTALAEYATTLVDGELGNGTGLLVARTLVEVLSILIRIAGGSERGVHKLQGCGIVSVMMRSLGTADDELRHQVLAFAGCASPSRFWCRLNIYWSYFQ